MDWICQGAVSGLYSGHDETLRRRREPTQPTTTLIGARHRVWVVVFRGSVTIAEQLSRPEGCFRFATLCALPTLCGIGYPATSSEGGC